MEKIKYFDRFSGHIETEQVYGEKWLKFAYSNPLGRLFLWAIVRRKLFSIWYGAKANRPRSKNKILPFIKKYGIDENEFAETVNQFSSFNEFFSRKLKPCARPISSSLDSLIFPADGRHLAFQRIEETNGIFVKGQKFDLPALFGSYDLASPFINGTLVLSRLCPVDYHRFHFPCDGVLKDIKLINGFLYSVNPIALRKNISIFWENKRYLLSLQSSSYGRVAQFAVGATCVGSVSFTKNINSSFSKGDECGYFSFGGSSILTLFEKNRIVLSSDLLASSKKGIEMYAKMGEVMGKG